MKRCRKAPAGGFCLSRTAFASIVMLSTLYVAFTPSSIRAQPVFLAGNDDQHWESVLAGDCTLIEGVPIVRKVKGISTEAAVLSSIMGYYNKILPVLGPPLAERVPDLLARMQSEGLNLTAREVEIVTEALYRVEAKNFEEFVEFSRKHPNQTEGVIRAYILDAHGVGSGFLRDFNVIQRIAKTNFQVVHIEKLSNPKSMWFKNVIDEKKFGLLSMGGGKFVYAVVGYAYGGKLAVVIDPESAHATELPAINVLLTKSDRESKGEFATRARDLLRDQRIAVDSMTTCTTKRPPGLRFIAPFNIDEDFEAFVFHQWALDPSQIRKMVKGEPG